MTQSKGHPHAALMLEYAKDAAEHAAPWLLWEFMCPPDLSYRTCDKNPNWSINQAFRRKTRTIRIGEIDVPEPLRVAPALDTSYFVVGPDTRELFAEVVWEGDGADCLWLSRGFVHLTREAAEAHARALIAVSGGEV